VYDVAGRLVANQPGIITEKVFQEAIDRLLEQKQ
jgi:hypothetical protein